MMVRKWMEYGSMIEQGSVFSDKRVWILWCVYPKNASNMFMGALWIIVVQRGKMGMRSYFTGSPTGMVAILEGEDGFDIASRRWCGLYSNMARKVPNSTDLQLGGLPSGNLT